MLRVGCVKSSQTHRRHRCHEPAIVRCVCEDLTHPTSPDAARRRAEIPEDDNNHALGALRYLIAKLDARKLGRKAKSSTTPPQPEQTEKPKEKKW